MIRLLAALILMTATGFIPGASPRAAETVIWLDRHFPPLDFLYGPQQGQGSNQKLGRLLAARLTEFDHVVLAVSSSRAELLMDADGVCMIGRLKTLQRQEKWQFSLPVYVYPAGIHVVIAATRLADFAQFRDNAGFLRAHSVPRYPVEPRRGILRFPSPGRT